MRAHSIRIQVALACAAVVLASGAQAAGRLPAAVGPSALAKLGAPPAGLLPSLPSGTLTLMQTRRTLLISGDPIWELRLEIPGQKPSSFEALVGRAQHQRGDRNRLGSQTPLPVGHYRIAEIVSLAEAKDLNPELGRVLWIGLQPEFPTARRALGIHLDPSAGLLKDSGTDGCIGLIDAQALKRLGDLLQRSGTTSLRVIN